jgi:hypothetical protein
MDTLSRSKNHSSDQGTPHSVLDAYFTGASSSERLDILRSIGKKNNGMPPSLVKALFGFDLPVAEKIALLESAISVDGGTAESFIFDDLVNWDQDLAARALRSWAMWAGRGNRASDLVRIALLPQIPQRILYTLLDIAPACDRKQSEVVSLIRACVQSAVRDPGGYLSPAFNGLMFLRLLQFNIIDERVLAIAEAVCDRASCDLLPDDKSAFAAWLYLRRFLPAAFSKIFSRVVEGSPQLIISALPADFLLKNPSAASTRKYGAKKAVAAIEDKGAAECLTWLTSSFPEFPVAKSWGREWLRLLAIGNPSTAEDEFRDSVAELRSVGGIFRIAYMRALGRRRGSDEAVLKLLDFIRSNDGSELREVARALSSIGTSRAVQELIAMISRPNAGVELQIEIAQTLRKHDLGQLSVEISSAASHAATKVRDIRARGGNPDGALEVWESLLVLIEKAQPQSAQINPVRDLEVGEMDASLSRTIPGYTGLSAEVKRALRTAWYFNRQIESNAAASSIDLSPVIDMQYKALELLFREFFEESCSRLIQTGVIQRKLDLIGYSRPIPAKMEEFERFISGLPVVESIPFFSKFKLRKMLLGLCQFKPGKRFTLDGLKAFGLFFLVFGRGDCRFGLEGIVPLVPGAMGSNDRLAEFCRLLHVFQDDRNRAAHEGFRPDAAADIRGIWRNTAEVIQAAFAVRKAFGRAATEPALVPGRAS